MVCNYVIVFRCRSMFNRASDCDGVCIDGLESVGGDRADTESEAELKILDCGLRVWLGIVQCLKLILGCRLF